MSDTEKTNKPAVLDICIRPAEVSDLDQLAPLFEALWPKSSAEAHAQEIRLILAGKAALTKLIEYNEAATKKPQSEVSVIQ